jgi:hypothetical protein
MTLGTDHNRAGLSRMDPSWERTHIGAMEMGRIYIGDGSTIGIDSYWYN